MTGRPTPDSLSASPVGSSDGASIESDFQVAQGYEKSGRLSEAEQIYKQLSEVHPDNAEVFRRYGAVVWSLQQQERSFALLRRAAELDPVSPLALTDMAEQYLALGQMDAAEQVMADAMARCPRDCDLIIKQALLSLRRGNKEKAVALCQQALGIDPQLLGAHQILGTYQWEKGELAKATEHLMIARRQSGRVHDPNALLAGCLYAMGRSREIDGLTACATESQLFLEVITQALWTWQAEKLEYCRHLLLRANDILPRLPRNAPRRGLYVLFQRLLTALLNFGAANAQRYEMPADAVLAVVGDTHCLPACHLPVPFQGQLHRMRAMTVLDAKARHLVDDTGNPQRSAFEKALDLLPSGTQILISLGELDCRHDGGLLAALKADPASRLEAHLSDFVGRYVARACQMANERGLEPGFLAPPMPNVRLKNLPLEDRELFTAINEAFNRQLKAAVAQAGRPLVDLYAATRDGEGKPLQDSFIDGHHCLPSAYLTAFEALADQGDAADPGTA